jgi:hypothetical protein
MQCHWLKLVEKRVGWEIMEGICMLRMIRLKPHRGELMCWSEKARGVDAGDGALAEMWLRVLILFAVGCASRGFGHCFYYSSRIGMGACVIKPPLRHLLYVFPADLEFDCGGSSGHLALTRMTA